MAFYEPIAERVKKLTPAELKNLADTKLSDLVRQEMPRARKRALELEQRYPSAGVRERPAVARGRGPVWGSQAWPLTRTVAGQSQSLCFHSRPAAEMRSSS
ncbi:MAG: hypothetical protein ACXU86_17250, partial [Archangium sp.]